jgi:hypothetical protein
MRNLVITLIMSFCAVANPAAAAAVKFDDSVPLLCVPIEITQCDEGGKCYLGTAEDVNLPQFIRVDLKEKKLSGVGQAADRTTPIDFLERENAKIVLHGRQSGRGWTAMISEETGKLVAAISDEGTVFIIFGACTALRTE